MLKSAKKKKNFFLIILAIIATVSFCATPLQAVYADDPSAATIEEDEDIEPDNGKANKKCKDTVGVIGWILCPLVINTASSVSKLYSSVKQNYMVMRPSLFTDDTLRTQWGIFRDIANIVFVILFMVVIFSQITGVGIDNYGIKRILPRLIVVAILINLSYIICQLAIDVSNIVGSSLVDALGGVAGLDGTTASPEALTIMLGETPLHIDLSEGGAGLLFIILICIVICFLAIIILFAFCLVRDIGAVVLVCTAPLALACTLLPNTEGIYKKWFNFSKIIVTLYPICAFTMGAGLLVATIFTKMGNTWLIGVAAILAATLPFVAIPYLLLNALAAFGSIGNKVAGWGRSKLTGAWRGAGRLSAGVGKVGVQSGVRTLGAVGGVGRATVKTIGRGIGKTKFGRKITSGAGAVSSRAKGLASTVEAKVAQSKAGKLASNVAKTEIGQSVGALGGTIFSGIKDTGAEAANAVKYAVKKPIANSRASDIKKAQERAEIDKYTTAYTQAAIEKAKMDTGNSAASLVGMYGNAERRAALQRSEESSRRNAEANADMYTTQYIEHKDRHYDTVRQNEAIKMNMEQFASQDKGAVDTELRNILTTLQTMRSDHPERAENQNRAYAAMRDLASKGATEELLNAAYAHSDVITADPRMVQELAGASPIFKEFAKNQAGPEFDTNPDGTPKTDASGQPIRLRATSFEEFVDSGKLATALAQNGAAAYGAFDKDNWKFAAAHPTTIETVVKGGAGPLAASLVNAQDGKTITAQVSYIENLTENDRKAVIQQISPEQFLKLSNDMRAALAGATRSDSADAKALKVGQAFSSQLEQIDKDNRLRGRMSQADNELYINHSQGPIAP